ncbi:MAG: entericidin A/B family lipoprotein [Desulfosoma sp.]
MHGGRSFGRVWAWLLALSLFLGAATGCNTVKGIGKDIRSLGGAIERSADGAK